MGEGRGEGERVVGTRSTRVPNSGRKKLGTLWKASLPSVNQHEHSGLFGFFHDLLKFLILRLRRFQLRRHFRHGFQIW